MTLEDQREWVSIRYTWQAVLTDGTQISACLIVRDEAALLPACLASLKGCVDEVCVVDTGSCDDTVQIAERAGCRVAQLAWQDDFAEARNASLAMATGEWVFVIDADERVTDETRGHLRTVVAGAPDDCLGWLVLRYERDQPRAAPVALPRLFRNHQDIRFSRPIHESIMDSLFDLGLSQLPDSGVRLMHVGYDPKVVAGKAKLDRNLRILRRHVRADPDDAFACHKLIETLPPGARGERGALFEATYERLTRANAAAVGELPFLPRFVCGFAQHLVADGHLTRATEVVHFGLRHFADSGELHHRAADLARRRGHFDGALACLAEAFRSRPPSPIRFEQPAALAIRCRITWHALAEDGASPERLPPWQGPTSIELVCAELRQRAFRDGPHGVAGEARALSGKHGAHPALRLLLGELALLSGDRAAARAHFAATSTDAEPGQRASLWSDLLAMLGPEPPGERRLGQRPVRDLADVALGILAGDAHPDGDLEAERRQAAERTWLPRLQGMLGRLRS